MKKTHILLNVTDSGVSFAFTIIIKMLHLECKYNLIECCLIFESNKYYKHNPMYNVFLALKIFHSSNQTSEIMIQLTMSLFLGSMLKAVRVGLVVVGVLFRCWNSTKCIFSLSIVS